MGVFVLHRTQGEKNENEGKECAKIYINTSRDLKIARRVALWKRKELILPCQINLSLKKVLIQSVKQTLVLLQEIDLSVVVGGALVEGEPRS